MNKIIDQIYLGNLEDAANLQKLKAHKVTHVL